MYSHARQSLPFPWPNHIAVRGSPGTPLAPAPFYSSSPTQNLDNWWPSTGPVTPGVRLPRPPTAAPSTPELPTSDWPLQRLPIPRRQQWSRTPWRRSALDRWPVHTGPQGRTVSSAACPASPWRWQRLQPHKCQSEEDRYRAPCSYMRPVGGTDRNQLTIW